MSDDALLASELRDVMLLRFGGDGRVGRLAVGVLLSTREPSTDSSSSLDSADEATARALLGRPRVLVEVEVEVAVTSAWEISSAPSMSLASAVSAGVGAFFGRPRGRGAAAAGAEADVEAEADADAGAARRVVLVCFLTAGFDSSYDDSLLMSGLVEEELREISSSPSDSTMRRTRRDRPAAEAMIDAL
jgi:hypothetical protein